MAERIAAINNQLNAVVWGPPMIALLIGTGLLLTVVTRGIQFRKLPFAFREVLANLFRRRPGEGTVRPFQALATALASTVGVGNIAGVSTAVAAGGPGAVFWLVISGVLGMATKFAEIAIAMHYRERDSAGILRGGAMYVLKKGLGCGWLGAAFALLTGIAGFGIGNMVQANSVADAMRTSFGVEPWVTGAFLVGFTALVVLGGIRRIAEVTQFLVPIMCVVYVGGCLVIVLRFASQLPDVLQRILESAFTGQAAMGGFAGATVKAALLNGFKRGLFSNEAGLGSAPIVHATAVTDHPVRQAAYGIFEVFMDTLVVCVMTGVSVLATGAWTSGDTGAALSARAFAIGLPGQWGHYTVSLSLVAFAFSTIIGWSYYGETAVTYLFGGRVAVPYRIAWTAFVYLGAVGSLQLVWSVADTLNGLMAIPNLIGVLGSVGLLLRMIREFFPRGRAAHGR